MSSNSAQSFSGTFCPDQAQFGYVQGPSASLGDFMVSGNVSVQPGTQLTLQIGSSSWTGFIIRADQTQDENGLQSKITAVDWRDRLSDNHVFCAFNVQEQDGRIWHMMPNDWANQQKTWIIKEMGQMDYNAAQNMNPGQNILPGVWRGTLFSAATLLNWLSSVFNFQWNTEDYSMKILKQTRPMNLEWTAGVTGAEALTQVLDKCGLQYTAYGMKNLYISLRGFSSNAFVNAYLNGGSICDTGAQSGAVGAELNEKGQRVIIVGDRNKYQQTYMARANWNQKWDYKLVFNEWDLCALLVANNLTRRSKIKELPQEYQDSETWTDYNDYDGKGDVPAHQTRNEMTIEEYMEQIVFRVYIIDAETIVKGLVVVTDVPQGTTRGINRITLQDNGGQGDDLAAFDPTLNGLADDNNFRWPLSQHLVTDSNLKFLAMATSQKVINGVDSPFETQLCMVPKSSGASIHSEEVIGFDGAVSYRNRIIFNERQLYIDQDKDVDDETRGHPDKVAVTVAVDKELFGYWQGAASTMPRVRTQKRSIRSLYRAFVNGNETAVLGVNYIQNIKQQKNAGNALFNLNPQGAVCKALDIAKIIATQMLFHLAINKSGNLHYEKAAGYTPDGLVDNVNVSFNARTGIVEDVNFTTGWMDVDNTPNVFALRVSAPIKMEDDLIRDRLQALQKAAMLDNNAVKRLMTLMHTGVQGLGSILSGVPAFGGFGGQNKVPGTVKASLPRKTLTTIGELARGDVVILGKKKDPDSPSPGDTTPP